MPNRENSSTKAQSWKWPVLLRDGEKLWGGREYKGCSDEKWSSTGHLLQTEVFLVPIYPASNCDWWRFSTQASNSIRFFSLNSVVSSRTKKELWWSMKRWRGAISVNRRQGDRDHLFWLLVSPEAPPSTPLTPGSPDSELLSSASWNTRLQKLLTESWGETEEWEPTAEINWGVREVRCV